ncbi:MAG: hypothetical protein HPY44_07885 [Armatimonadetes bacterium]|nr:hypothetical protein [Armatimonadota bacterium]
MLATGLLLSFLIPAGCLADGKAPLNPTVEAEEEVYSYTPADNGAAPTWCWGCPILVRVGDSLFTTGLETLPEAKPLNNVRWTLYQRTEQGWELQQADPTGRTREPCPLVALPDGRLIISAHPTLVTDPQKQGGGPAQPQLLQFDSSDPKAPPTVLLPEWDGAPAFTEHTYRYFCTDPVSGEVLVLNNVGYLHKEWALLKSDGTWATGRLESPPARPGDIEPYGSTHCRPHYGSVVLKGRAAWITGAVAYDNWDRVGKPEAEAGLTGRKWGNRWRRLMITRTPNITTTPFTDWVEISNTFATGGWLFPGDLWVDEDGAAHVLWYEGPISQALRDQHFPDIKRIHAIRYAVLREGEIIRQSTIMETGEGLGNEVPGARPRFQVTSEGRLFAVLFVSGWDAAGKRYWENRVVELLPDGSQGQPVRLPLKFPLSEFFTATPRGGSPASATLDLIGTRVGAPVTTLYYARVKLW